MSIRHLALSVVIALVASATPVGAQQYGVYVGDQSGAQGTNYNVFSAGTNSTNVFQGKVGVGTTTPGAQLQVTGGETILEQEAWTTVTFQNSWANYAPTSTIPSASYFKDSTGIVHLRGEVVG